MGQGLEAETFTTVAIGNPSVTLKLPQFTTVFLKIVSRAFQAGAPPGPMFMSHKNKLGFEPVLTRYISTRSGVPTSAVADVPPRTFVTAVFVLTATG